MAIHVTPIPRLTTLAAPAFTLGTANAAGAALTAVASNSTLLTYDTTDPAPVAAAAAVGTASTAARRDHVHIGTTNVVILATGSDTRTSTTTFSDATNGFQFSAIAGVNYIVEMYLPFGGINDGGGAKIQLTVPSGASYIGFSRTFAPVSNGTGHVNSASQWTTSAILAGGSDNTNNAIVTFRILNPSNTGNVTMQWAQNASSGNTVTLQATAWMSYTAVTGT